MAKKRTSKRSGGNTLTVSTLARKLKEQLPAVAVIVGKEDLLRREARDLILSSLEGGKPPADVIQTISAQSRPDESRLQEIFDDLQTPSLFGGIPIVVLEGADRWLKSSADSWIDFIGAAQPNSLLILIAEQLDGRSKVSKKLKETGWWITADRPFHRPPPLETGGSPLG